MLTTSTVSKGENVRSAKISTHCFIHPEWEKSFDPAYDVALVFLSESLNLNQEQVYELLQLKISNGKEETLRVIGHPQGRVHMRESSGQEVYEKSIDSDNIINSENKIYHSANTFPGSSGSPILSDCNHIIGTHTKGKSSNIKANSGVRMRKELLSFIDESIGKHEEFLNNMDEVEELRQK